MKGHHGLSIYFRLHVVLEALSLQYRLPLLDEALSLPDEAPSFFNEGW
jgi:hypothetical protein